MLIGMDGKRAMLNNTGLGNYSRYAVNILSLAFPGARFRLYSPQARENERLKPLLDRDNVELFVPTLHPALGLTRSFWRTVDLPLQLRKDEVAVYHGLSNELPLTIKGICPSVVTIHDLIWRRSPGDYSAVDRRLYDFKYGHEARPYERLRHCRRQNRCDISRD